jgi:hypothetical protein
MDLGQDLPFLNTPTFQNGCDIFFPALATQDAKTAVGFPCCRLEWIYNLEKCLKIILCSWFKPTQKQQMW